MNENEDVDLVCLRHVCKYAVLVRVLNGKINLFWNQESY